MIYFTLPNLAEDFMIHNSLYTMMRKFRDYMRYSGVCIGAQSGNFSYCSWNGDINNNVGNGYYYPDLLGTQMNSMVCSRINCANVFLEDYDINDNLGQMILKTFDDGSTVLEISSIPFMEQILEQYPGYQFHFSKYADLISPFTPELLNDIAATEKFVSIGVPDKYSNDFEWLGQLKKKRLFEITIDSICPPSCVNFDHCRLKEQANQLKYSGMSLIYGCNKVIPYYANPNVISLDTIMKDYVPKGFTHFAFSTCYSGTVMDRINFYVEYFFKPEHWETVKNEMLMDLNNGGVLTNEQN